MINKVTLIGNLGQDPEFRTLDNGTAVCRLSLATSESYKDDKGEWQQVVQWHNVILWRELATRASQALKKGHQVYIEGKITYRKNTDQNGVVRYYTDIVANLFKRLTKVDKVDGHIPDEEPPQHHQEAPPASTQPVPAVGDDDDLPF